MPPPRLQLTLAQRGPEEQGAVRLGAGPQAAHDLRQGGRALSVLVSYPRFMAGTTAPPAGGLLPRRAHLAHERRLLVPRHRRRGRGGRTPGRQGRRVCLRLGGLQGLGGGRAERQGS